MLKPTTTTSAYPARTRMVPANASPNAARNFVLFSHWRWRRTKNNTTTIISTSIATGVSHTISSNSPGSPSVGNKSMSIPHITNARPNRVMGASKNWHMARDRRLWIDGQKQIPGAAPQRAVTGFATTPESIRFCLPAGCGSFRLKEECSSVGVSPGYASLRKFFLSFRKSSATRRMRIFRGSPRSIWHSLLDGLHGLI